MAVLIVIVHISIIVLTSDLIVQINCWGNRQGGDLKWPSDMPSEWQNQNSPDFGQEREPGDGDYDFMLSNRGGHGQDSGIFLDSDDIDLTRIDYLNHCVEHIHKRSNFHYIYNKSPTINISVGEESHKCIEIYDISGCKGMSLQFLNVTRKTLYLNNHVLAAEPEKEKLMNFNLCPKSLKKCIPVEKYDKVELEKWKNNVCKVSFQIQINSFRKTSLRNKEVSDVCIDIEKPQLDTTLPNYGNADLSLFVTKRSEDMVCMELYTEKNCKGEVVRLIIPPLTVSPNPPDPPVLLWEYFANSPGQDINSVRKCTPCLAPPPMPPKKGGQNWVTITASSQTEATVSSTLISTTGETSDTSENLDSGSQYCLFLNCIRVQHFISSENLSKLVTKLNEVEGRCYFFFNEPQCSTRPMLQDDKVNLFIMEQVNRGKFQEFAGWSIANCSDRHNDTPKECISPLMKGKTLIDVYKLELINGTGRGAKGITAAKYAIADAIIIGVAGTATIITLFIVLIMLVLLWRKKRRIRMIRANHCVSKRANNTSSPTTPQPQRHLNVHQIDPIDDNDYVSDITGLQALIKCFAKDKYELSRESINFGNIRDSTASIIGVGEFSIAFKGRLEPSGRNIAVKTMKSGQATARSMKGALKECQVFMMVGKHARIVEFIGVCTEGVRKGELLVVMEFCEVGSLKGFLAQQRSHFVSLVDEEETIPDNEQTVNEALRPLQPGPPVRFNTFQLFKWCWEVADALEFLATRKIVHVSLSTKNVLLDSNYSSKICDFHLAKIPGKNSISGYNRRTNTNKLQERHIPWRWFAVESLLDDIFTEFSDIWTYGIFMWEVFTMGNTPYPEYHHGPEFTLCLKHGYRLLKPSFATIDCYELMLMCWYDAPEKRPTFTKLKSRLEEIMVLKSTLETNQ